MELTFNNEFYNLIPPLSPEELSSLEASIKQEGCRDPLVVWNNTIIDGHHRYSICTADKYGKKIATKTVANETAEGKSE